MPGPFIYIKLWAAGGHAAGTALMSATATAGSYPHTYTYINTHTYAHNRHRVYVGCAQRENTCTYVCACMCTHTLAVTQANEVNQASMIRPPPSAAIIVMSALFFAGLIPSPPLCLGFTLLFILHMNMDGMCSCTAHTVYSSDWGRVNTQNAWWSLKQWVLDFRQS